VFIVMAMRACLASSFRSFLVKPFFVAWGVGIGLVMTAGMAWAQTPPVDPGTPMIAPPPPRMLDPATATLNGEGPTPGVSQREHCRQLLDQLNGLSKAPQQWEQGKSSVTTADGRTYSTLERAPDRKRLEEAYRQECAQSAR
jgi:hypothetical protein